MKLNVIMILTGGKVDVITTVETDWRLEQLMVILLQFWQLAVPGSPDLL